MTKKDYQLQDKQALMDEIISLKNQIISLKKPKKYGLVWECKQEDVVKQCEKNLPILEEVKSLAINTNSDQATNLLIEGDNYHALSVLNYTHNKEIDVIYIDPPYNTGAKDWKYDNNFVDKTDGYRHSKWLSMMANRLTLAKRLLKKDGVLICAIDENEFNRLGLLLEEIYPSHEIHFVTIVHNPRGVQGKNFSYTHEYACFVFRSGEKIIGNKQRNKPLEEELRDHGGSSLRTNAKNCFYPILVKNNKIIGFGDVPDKNFHPTGKNMDNGNGIIAIWPIDKNGIERKWVFARHSVDEVQSNLFVKSKQNGELDIFRIKNTHKPKTVWHGEQYDASTYGSKIVNKLATTQFPYPKSLNTVQECLECIIKDKKNSLILDFFAGSGTTGHAVSLLNKEDGGNRRFILCTNNENKIAREVCYPRIKAVIKGHRDYPDITGIPSNLKYFKTAFVAGTAINPTDGNKAALTRRADAMLCVKEGTFDLVKQTATYKIFRNKNRYTGIIYKPTAIINFEKAIAKIDGQFSVYIFSLSDEDFSDFFTNTNQRIKLHPIPEIILRVYRQIFK